MKFFKLFTVAALLLIGVTVQAQDPATDALGGGGIVYVDAPPTYTRTLTSAAFAFDVTNEILYHNAQADGTWTAMPMSAASQLSELSDVNTSTATAANILVADGTDWESVAISGAISMTAAGVTTIAAGGINDQANGLDIDVTTSAGAISIGYDFTENTNLGAAPDAADEFLVRDDTDGSYKAVTFANLGISSIYAADGTLAANRTVTFLDGTTSTLTFDDGTNTLMTLTDAGTTGTLAVTGNATVGLDLTVTGNDITFGNAETISNATDGIVLITAPTVQTSADLQVDGAITLGDAAADALTIAGSTITMTNLPEYASISAANTALADNVIWQTSATNDIGLPKGALFAAD